MLLQKIIQNIECVCSDDANIEITGIAYDSRRVKKGDLFVAIKGLVTDGHKFIGMAVERGAAAVLAESGYPAQTCPVPTALVKNSREALAMAAAEFHEHPARKMKVVGITGTNGKTTTSYLIKQILDLRGFKTGLIGTNQNMICDEVIPAIHTTPESSDLQALLRQMADRGVQYVIMEVSSHSLALGRVAGIEFETGVFTNLTQDHLDFHSDMDTYLSAKAQLLKMSSCSVINADDKSAQALKEAAKATAFTYAVNKKADFRATDISLTERGVIFYAMNGGITEVKLSIPGMFSVYNGLAAMVACHTLGISMTDCARGLRLAKGVKGRAEVVPLLKDYTVLIDYAHTPDGLENIISTVRDYAKGRVITLFGCGGDRDGGKRPLMGEIAARLSDYTIVTSDNPRTENPLSIIEEIVAGMEGYEKKYKMIENRRDAIRYALENAVADDVIILAGKGHEAYQILGHETIDFDERKIVREILAEQDAAP